MRFCSFFFLSLLLHCNLSWSQESTPRPKIGIALQGGGAKGLAHIGVLQWFEDHHIPVDYIAGTSMGGLVGGLYATGHSPEEIQSIVHDADWSRVLSGRTPYPDLAFRRKEDLRTFPNGLEFGLRQGVRTPGGLNSGQEVRFIIDRYVLPYSNVRSFDQLPTPFRCVGTDLVSGKSIVFESGSLANALRATMSIPGAFSPVRGDGKVLADGGLLNNLPTDVVKHMGADVVIGVHLTTGPVVPKNVSSLFEIAGRSMSVMIDANELRGMEQADILITVELAGFSTLNFSPAQEIISRGIKAAEARSAVLSRFTLNDKDWKLYLAERESRKVNSVPVPEFVEVTGTSEHLANDIHKELLPLVGQPVSPPLLEEKLTQQIGLGRFNSLSYSLADRDGRPGLLITAEEKDYSPPWLKPGFTIDGSDPNNVQFTFGARLNFLDVGGYRSEVRTDFSFGATYSFAMEYYHPFTTTSRWFIAPAVNASRSSLNLYSGDTFLAEYKVNHVDGGVDIGYGFDRFSELRVGYQAGYAKVNRWVGSPLLPSVSGRTGRTEIRYVMDRRDSPVIPRRGTALLVNSGWTDGNPGAKKGFPSGELRFEWFRMLSPPASIYFIAEGGSTFGHENVGVPLFSLGGPPRLAAYGVNQFLTDQYFYFRAGYLRRLRELPAFFGNATYLVGHYELAKVYGLPNAPVLPNNGVVGLIMDTILGPIEVGGSVGESGRRKWFFQIGRIF